MKIVQSFWSGNDVKRNFGWFSEKHHLLGWILSSVQLTKFYEDVTLYTDDAGYELLIQSLKLPYTSSKKTIEVLNRNDIDSDLWAYSKILTYNSINVPFLHVDGDVFIWESFGELLLSKDLIVQNKETTSDYYREMWLKIRPFIDYLPDTMQLYDKGWTSKAFNMGIFGGNDFPFIKKYSESAIQFIELNRKNLPKNQSFNFNIFFEQVLLYNMAFLEEKKVSSLIKFDIGDNEYKNFGNFDEVPNERTYLHLLGFFKREFTVCNKLDIYVQKYLPEYYSHLEEYLCIKNKLYHFGHTYQVSDHQKYITKYLESVKTGIPILNDQEAIFSRNILSEGQVALFEYFLANSTSFILYKLTHFRFDSENQLIKIETSDDLTVELPALSIDSAIFDLIEQSIDREDFEVQAITYLDDDFPPEQRENFIILLYQRISIFVSLGIVYVQEVETSIKNFHERRQDEVDA